MMSCPLKCTCQDAFGVVDCKGKRLSEIPSDLPGETEVLDLSENNITSLIPLAFQDLHKLSLLHLDRNQLKNIDVDVFSNLQGLQTISLSYNSVVDIDLSFISNLPSFVHLDMANNKIKKIKAKNLIIPPKLLVVDLSKNPLDCCENAWLINIGDVRIEGQCCFPTDLNGTELEDLRPEQLNCTNKAINAAAAAKYTISVTVMCYFYTSMVSIF